MVKRTKKRQASGFLPAFASFFRKGKGELWIAFLLVVVTFLVYWPSLQSDFVYDARQEVLDEGFVISPSNLPEVLSLKVIETDVMLKDRPGQILYMMLVGAVGGKKPFAYHLGSNLLQAATVALLFILLRRLIANEMTDTGKRDALKVQLALIAVTLIFALHPIAVESVAEVSYCASLLVTFFTLLALLMATAFRTDNFRVALLTGSVAIFCAFAAVISKESGAAVAPLLIVYWFLYRRREAKAPWLIFLGGAMAVTMVFLAALFILSASSRAHLDYLGGSISQVFLIQPRLWVFMMGKLLWPVGLSAHYTLPELGWLSTPLALAILLVVILAQTWLAYRSRLGALGVAVYWLGLATVSNLVPLFRPTADRFYHLPLAGIAMQLLALLLMSLRWRLGFWVALALVLGAILPLTFLTLVRENAFANDISLWSDTIRVNPFSPMAHDNLGSALMRNGEMDEAEKQYMEALKISPRDIATHNNLGLLLMQKGRTDEAIAQYRQALEIDPTFIIARNNLGLALCQKGQVDEAIADYAKILKTRPGVAQVHNNLGLALEQKGQLSEALLEFEKAVQLKPDYSEAQNNAARAKAALSQKINAGSK